jgi:protein involved in polysaccharide export with SLBB domain
MVHGAALPSGINANAINQLSQQMKSGGLSALSNSLGGGTGASRSPSTSKLSDLTGSGNQATQGQPPPETQDDKADRELEELKAKDTGPHRFAQDLFNFRDHTDQGTDGGIGEDYVLQTGDGLALLMTGDMDDHQEPDVDGRGEVAIHSVGSVKVAGLSLAQATRQIESAVRGKFSRTDVSVRVTRLREVRVFILGEVYRPGSYVVPSLSSCVNVLSMAGGPDALGSYRKIRLVRGGRTVQTIDLYALRAEGEGNFNLSFQNGDTLFVPLAGIQVLLEGAFTRVVGLAAPPPPDLTVADGWTRQRDRLQKDIQAIKQQLDTSGSPSVNGQDASGAPSAGAHSQSPAPADALAAASSQPGAAGAAPLTPDQRVKLEAQLEQFNTQLADFQAPARGDHRLRPVDLIKPEQEDPDASTQPWIQHWLDQGIAPRLQFELLPSETVADVLRYAGGLLDYAYQDTLTLRRRGPGGIARVLSLPVDDAATLQATHLQRGDLLSALPSREDMLRAVTVQGWAQSPGRFARSENLRVGDMLRRDHQALPDTFLGRGEILRTRKDGSKTYLSFQVDRAMAGDPTENVLLEDRDQVELYRSTDFIQDRTVTVSGPMTRPGDFPFYQGMRAADLLFRAGTPLRSANEMGGELARFKDGKISEVIPLDLSPLLTTELQNPAMLRDDQANPPLQPDDRISVFEKPNFRIHRIVTLGGEVGKPGDYVIDSPSLTLSQLIKRAGGLTAEAMPRAGFFVRNPKALDPPAGSGVPGLAGAGGSGSTQSPPPQNANGQGGSLQAGSPQGGTWQADPTAMGINEILSRMAETKRQPVTGQIQNTPLLHGLVSNHSNRLVVDFEAALSGVPGADVELEDGDVIIIPHKTDSVYVVGETVSPFGVYKAASGLTVSRLLDLAGGTTRNADTWNIRLLKSNGRIIDHRVKKQDVEPGDVVLVPQKIRRDTTWQENLQALTPLAILFNAIHR